MVQKKVYLVTTDKDIAVFKFDAYWDDYDDDDIRPTRLVSPGVVRKQIKDDQSFRSRLFSAGVITKEEYDNYELAIEKELREAAKERREQSIELEKSRLKLLMCVYPEIVNEVLSQEVAE